MRLGACLMLKQYGTYGIPIRYEHILDPQYCKLIVDNFNAVTLARDAKFSDIVIWRDDSFVINQNVITKISKIRDWCKTNNIKLSGGNILTLLPDFLPKGILHISNLEIVGQAYFEYFLTLIEKFSDIVWHINEIFMPDGSVRQSILKSAIEIYTGKPLLQAVSDWVEGYGGKFFWCDYRLQDVARWESVMKVANIPGILGIGIQCHHQTPLLQQNRILDTLHRVLDWTRRQSLAIEISELSFTARLRLGERQLCAAAYPPLLKAAGKIPVTFWAFHDGLPFPSPNAECGLFDTRLQPTAIYDSILVTIKEMV